jgi:hypothetical protein
MAVDHIRYDLLTQDALRGVVRRVLQDAAKNGLPGEHHFFISFDTQAEGVRMSGRLREQYPKDMTIILQHQFWDLRVDDDHFEIGLSFGGVPERLVIPFAAIKGFFDPSVQFGLQFETVTIGEQEPSPEAPAEQPTTTAKEAAPAPARSAEPEPAKPGAEVVRLDRFRKK